MKNDIKNLIHVKKYNCENINLIIYKSCIFAKKYELKWLDKNYTLQFIVKWFLWNKMYDF